MRMLHLAVVTLSILIAPLAQASGLPAKLDPRLASSLAALSEPVPVWVEFADKGEQGPSDLVERLAQAERALSPESRARREWAGVSPIVDYLDLPLDESYVASLRAMGFSPYGQSRWFNGVAVHASGIQLEQLARLTFVRRLAPTERAMPHHERQSAVAEAPQALWPAGADGAEAVNVAYGRTAGQLARLGVPAMHDSGYIGTGILIAVFDEGFNYHRKHEATRNLSIGVGRQRDFVEGDLSVQDTLFSPVYFQHGQWTLSTLGGNKPGGYVGPAYGAQFALARTENSASETPVELVNWAMAAEWADSIGARIISSSLGYNVMDSPYPSLTYDQMNGHTTLITRAAEIAASRGILVVNSAGNDGNAFSVWGRKLSAPSDANGDSVLCIASVDSTGNRSSFSSVGPAYGGAQKPDLAAQGTSTLVASASGDPAQYIRLNGTSFSCPLVAGVAACLMQARPTWTPRQIIRALRSTASKSAAPDTLLGYGVPNGLAALRWGSDTVDVPDPSRASLQFSILGSNPVQPSEWPVALRFSIPADRMATSARVRVYDMLGRIVATPWAGTLAPGVVQPAQWDGRQARSGIYLVALEAGGERVTRRLVSIR